MIEMLEIEKRREKKLVYIQSKIEKISRMNHRNVEVYEVTL